MKANIKCSSCGAEISNLSMSWGKQWLWSFLFLPMAFLPLLFLYRDSILGKPDFRQELTVSISKSTFGEDEAIFVGVIENTGEHTWDGISIEVEFFDDSDVFVDEVDERLSFSLAPGDKENFKLTRRTDANLSAYRYEVKVVDANKDIF